MTTSHFLKTLRRFFLPLFAFLILAGTAQAHNGPAADHQDGIAAKGYAVMKPGGIFEPFEFKRRPVGDDDILIEILYSGICHSDIHKARGEWGKVNYPIVPGHEIVGRVVKVGKNVTKFRAGDIAGVGCMIDSCGKCVFCLAGKEQYCLAGATFTYGQPGVFGGYSTNIVVTQRFALKIPDGIPPEQAAPLLCAGVTTYSPMKALNIRKGQKVGIAGLGGLGHMALQYAKVMGAEVTVFEITDSKIATARKLGA
ncbi:MAG: NAD(P)-dependent alcohol dehydrogenase, partial [Burkholderiaceae bacterium]|nr:NAD(P)-dependent alcohol dehydrogenase [Burkholderiaceae bacterium]